MALGDVAKFTSNQVLGRDKRDKLHIFVAKTDHFRAPEPFVFLFISSADYGQCFPISKKDYPNILEHDSYISCSNLVFYSEAYLKEAKLKRIDAILPKDLLALRNHLVDHDTMVQWQIKLVCNELAKL